MRHAIALSVLLLSACPTIEKLEGSSDVADVDEDAATQWPLCEPGTVQACVIDGAKEALICNEWGDSYDKRTCTGVYGQETVCLDGRCAACNPLDYDCEGDGWVVQCRADGSGFDRHLPCDLSQGKVCRQPGSCQSLCELNYKLKSYIGCDYWAVDLDNAFVPGGDNGFYDAMNAQFAIVVAVPPDSPVPAEVSVTLFEGGAEIPLPYETNGAPAPTAPIQPGELRIYRVGPRNVNGTEVAPKAYRITASAPVLAYQFNPLDDEGVFSNDASLLLPATLIGRSYYVLGREQTHETLRSYLTVVTTSPGTTEVLVDTTAPTLPGYVYPGAPDEVPIPHLMPGDTGTFRLQQFDVLNLETDRPGADLTGTRIVADKRIAVFSGAEAANAPNTARCIPSTGLEGTSGHCESAPEVPCETMSDCVDAGLASCCADHLEQQLMPVSTLGARYFATKSWERGVEEDVWRILAVQDNTHVVLNPPQDGITVPVLQRGEWFELSSKGHFEVLSVDDKPIMVGQFLPTQAATGQPPWAAAGDPSFLLAVPAEQFQATSVFLVPEQYESSYVNVVAPTGAEVRLDGEVLEATSAEPIGGSGFVVFRRPVETTGSHVVTASEPCGVTVYGYDRHVSYGYPGGTSLQTLQKDEELD